MGIPAFSLPLLEAERMPVGVQLIGAAGSDGALAACANWLMKNLSPAH